MAVPANRSEAGADKGGKPEPKKSVDKGQNEISLAV